MVSLMAHRIALHLRSTLPAEGERPHWGWPAIVGLAIMVAFAVALGSLWPPASARAAPMRSVPGGRAVAAAVQADAPLPVVSKCGEIGSETWTAGNVYVINCGVSVPATATLTIQPGTVVKGANKWQGIWVSGGLNAQGTAAAPIVFTSIADDVHGGDTNGDGTATAPKPGDWCTISFAAGSRGRIANAFVGYGGYSNCDNKSTWDGMVYSASSDVVLDRVTLQGSGSSGLHAAGASVSLSNSTVISNTGSGFYYNGVDATVPLMLTDNTFTGQVNRASAYFYNPGYAGVLALAGNPEQISLLRNTASGNLLNGFRVSGVITGDLTWDNTGSLPLILDGGLSVGPTATLTLQPGTVVKLPERHQGIWVSGGLNAQGTAGAPIAFTSVADDIHGGDTNGDGTATAPSPGDWCAIFFNAGSRGRIANAFIGYGGWDFCNNENYRNGMVYSASGDLGLERVTLQGSWTSGLYVNGGSPSLHHSVIISNAFGVRNAQPADLMDARVNWWGDASGPYHQTSNTDGKGNGVSDGVMYFPWVTDRSTGQRAGLQVTGPSIASPGQRVDYAISYANGPDETIENAVAVLILPVAAVYVDSTAGGIYWPERHEVFWRLGNLAPEASGTLSARLRYYWGVPSNAVDTAVGILVGTNVGQAGIVVAPYLTYTPRTIAGAVALSSGELQSERATYADLEKIYGEAIAAGFILGEASRLTMSGGESVVQVVLFNGNAGSVMYLRRQGLRVQASTFDRTSYAIRDATGGMTQSVQLGTTEYWGSWASASGDVQAQGLLSMAECFRNCVMESIPGWLVANKIKSIGAVLSAADCFDAVRLGDLDAAAKCAAALKDIPGAGEVIDTVKCAADCAGDPDTHLCKGDKVTCDQSW
ncbi:MAG: hypothetical protein HY331_02905 [Chloroflexi bacterium]|nr:hypothetical protein [Chloroflexota bacterium]